MECGQSRAVAWSRVPPAAATALCGPPQPPEQGSWGLFQQRSAVQTAKFAWTSEAGRSPSSRPEQGAPHSRRQAGSIASSMRELYLQEGSSQSPIATVASTVPRCPSKGCGACAAGTVYQQKGVSPGRHPIKNGFWAVTEGTEPPQGISPPLSSYSMFMPFKVPKNETWSAQLKNSLFHGLENVLQPTDRGSWQKAATGSVPSTKSEWGDVMVTIKSVVFKQKRQMNWTEPPIFISTLLRVS